MTNQEQTSVTMPDRNQGALSAIVFIFLRGNLSFLFIILSLIGGVAAILLTPREEEPQIVVPMADVFVKAPGIEAREIERLVSTRLEKLLYQVDGVEYVYSMSRPGEAVVTVRFYVGEDREDSLIKLHNKLAMHRDQVPPIVESWLVRPVEIDDVPILNITLASDRLGGPELRRLAEEIELRLQSVPDTGRTYLIGGQPRQLQVALDPERLASRQVTVSMILAALRQGDAKLPAGTLFRRDGEITLEAGARLSTPAEVGALVVRSGAEGPVYLRDVAKLEFGPAEIKTYTRFGLGPAAGSHTSLPPELEGARQHDLAAVTIALAKKKGSNAVWVSDNIQTRLEGLKKELLPEGVAAWITRDYGETANDKVNELLEGLAIAVVIVIALIALIMGWHSGLVVAAAVPITFALVLLINMLLGYTINRVTLFALILSLGLVVDDPIVDVENIYRHLKMGLQKPIDAVLSAVNEMRPPIILATLAVIVSFLPMAFITGMMGPYMAPMALNVPMAMLMSMVVAFTVTPWLAFHVLKKSVKSTNNPEDKDIRTTVTYAVYNRIMAPMVNSRALAWGMLSVVTLLFLGAGSLVFLGKVPLKMLPFDNKNEFQIIVDMPEGTPLEETQAVCSQLSNFLRTVPEVTDFTTYAGVSSPMDFNGLVRHYYLRQEPHLADIRINLLPKKKRQAQSHAICLRLRPAIKAIEKKWPGASFKIVESPPGPPVVATITVEVRGDHFTPYTDLVKGANILAKRLGSEEGVVDVDVMIEKPRPKLVFLPDREKAALAGVSNQALAETVTAAFAGVDGAWLHQPREANPLPIVVQLPRNRRSFSGDLAALKVPTASGAQVPLLELGKLVEQPAEQTIYHKNMDQLVYVSAEMAGKAPADAVLAVSAELEKAGTLPPGVKLDWAGEGEWKITLDVFRDLGLAFAAALLGIYVLLVHQTGSFFMPMVLMISIPLSIIGIMPGFWLLNLIGTSPAGGFDNPIFFTATAMIGMIGLSGIAVRNAILLIDFIQLGRAGGLPLKDAILQSGAIRFRPILLTAGTAILAAIPITLDPIFSGLAWSLIFGLFVSSAFTLIVVPVVYYMVAPKNP